MSETPKKSRIFKVIGVLLISGLVLGIALFSLKKNLAKYAIVRYLNGKDISISFDLEKLTTRELLVRDIVLAEKIKIPLVHLKFDGLASLDALQEVIIQVESVDVATLLDIKNKFKSDDSSRPLTFLQLRGHCSQAQEASVQLSLESLTWNDLQFPLNVRMTHTANTQDFTLNYASEFPANQDYGNVHLGHGSSVGQLHISCASEKISVSLPTLTLAIEDLRKGDQVISKARLNLSRSVVNFTPENKMALTLPAQGSITFSRGQKNFQAIINHFILEAQTSLVQSDSIQGRYSLSKISIKRDSEVLLQNLLSEGAFTLGPAASSATVNVTDAGKTLNFKNVKVIHETKSGAITVDFPEAKSFIRLNNNMSTLSPFLGTIVKTASGRVNVEGQLSQLGEEIKGPLHLIGKSINMDSEYGQVKNLNFKHDLLALPSMKSGVNQKISVAAINAGTLLNDLSLRYQVADKSRLNVEKMELHYEGAEILTNSFVVHPLVPNVENLKAKITNLPLENALKLALKDTVTAEGLLSGHVNIRFHKKVPIIDGQLSANSPGWIRYRTGNKQTTAIHLSDGPMEILNAYLYDFYYETLSIEFKSDEKYEMIMTLSTYGRNPGYLKGKPLKLKVNLQQNILASFQAMMLTYDLPNKLKERLEKVGN